MSGKAVRETLGFIGVMASLVFVGLEIRQNTTVARAQTRDSITEKQIETIGWQATSPQLAALHVRVMDGEELSGADASQFGSWVVGQLREWENSHYQFEAGLFTPAEFEARSEMWRILLSGRSSAAYIETWRRFRLTFAPNFRAEIDRIVAEAAQ